MKKIFLLILFSCFTSKIYSQIFRDSAFTWLMIAVEGYGGFTKPNDYIRAQFGLNFDNSDVELKNGLGLNIRYFEFYNYNNQNLPFFLKTGFSGFVKDKKEFIWSIPISCGTDYYFVKKIPIAINAELGARYFFKNSYSTEFSNNFKFEYGAGLKYAFARFQNIPLIIQLGYRRIGIQSFAHANSDIPIKVEWRYR